MKLLFFAVSDMLQEQIVSGLQSLEEHEATIVFYDRLGIPPDREMLNAADRVRPDAIIWTGRHGGPTVAITDTFIRLRKIAPTIMMLHDGTETLWQNRLNYYVTKDLFSLIVNIDGNSGWPHRPADLTLLTPIDPRFYMKEMQ